MKDQDMVYLVIASKIYDYKNAYGKDPTILVISKNLKNSDIGYGKLGDAIEYLGLKVILTNRDVVEVY